MESVDVSSDVYLFRQGLLSVLVNDCRLSVAAVVANADELQALLAGEKVETPSAVLLDWGMPRTCPMCCVIVRDWPETKITALCMTECARGVGPCVETGVAGIVSGDGSLDLLVPTVKSTVNGDPAYSERIAALLLFKTRSIVGAATGGTWITAVPSAFGTHNNL